MQHVILGTGGVQVAVLENAASAVLYGLDGDVVIAPTRALRLNAGFNLEHSRYKKYTGASGFVVENGSGVPAVFDEKGKQVLAAPSLPFNAAGSYRLDLGHVGNLLFSANYGYSSHFKISPGDGNGNKSYGLLNTSVAYSDADNRFTIELWGRNLTDVRRYGTYTTQLGSGVAGRPPVTYGATVSTRF